MDEIKTILTSISDNVYCFTARNNQSVPYIVYSVDGENVLKAGNFRAETVQEGTIDLYTKNQSDPLILQIPDALELHQISFYLNSVQYEDETGTIHYEWVWQA